MSTATLVYSTTTGADPVFHDGFAEDLAAFDGAYVDPAEQEWPAFCFVCSRVTEHAGEHDDLVAAGLVTYAEDGNVLKTEAYTSASALAVIRAAEAAATGR